MERRRLQNWAEERIADLEERQKRGDPAAPEWDECIAWCMRLCSAKPESNPAAKPNKQAYENVTTAPKTGKACESQNSRRLMKPPTTGPLKMDRVDQGKLIQSGYHGRP